ncbi:MAG: hypothetical protein EBS01_04735 [Verrucomicrobia bacterium]|nr:hypothetical protein [Verrucomicrobiota bacterium]
MNASLGLDFGTESVRALLVTSTGRELASKAAPYRHGQIIKHLPGSLEPLPAQCALQHPEDWILAAAKAVRSALRAAKLDAASVIGIGVVIAIMFLLSNHVYRSLPPL